MPRNLDAALAAVDAGIASGAELLALPEMWPTSFAPAPGEDELVASAEALDALCEHVRGAGVAVVGSTFGRPADPTASPNNRAHVIVDGEVRATHDKVHLFSPTAERLAFSAGDRPPPVLDLFAGEGRGAGGPGPERSALVSPIICYDLRFPEVARAAFRGGAEVLVACAQWPVARQSHLTALARGRAVELLGFVVIANRRGVDVIGRRRMELRFDARTCVVAAPSGELLEPLARTEVPNAGREPTEVSTFELDLAEARALRRAVPVTRDARNDLFPGWLTEGPAPERA